MPSPDLFASIFSPGDTSEFDSDSGSPVIVSSPTHCGGYALKCKDDDDFVVVNVSEDELYARMYVRYDTEPTAGSYQIIRNIHFLGDAGVTAVCRCYMESRPGGKLFRLHLKYPSTLDYYYYFDWQINTWYCIELYFKKHASTGRAKLYVNDTLILDSGDKNTSGAPTIDTVQFGIADYANPTSPFSNVYIDCIAVADSGPIGTHDNDFTNGFEEGDFSAYDAPVGSPSLSFQDYHCGNTSMQASIAPTESEGVYKNLGHQKEVYAQFEVKFLDASPASGETVYFAYVRESTDSSNILALFLTNEGGTVKWGYTYRSAGSTVSATEDTVGLDPDGDTWYCVKVRIVMSSRDGDAEGSYAMYIDDILCDDIDVSAVDTDYTGVAVLRLVSYTAQAGGATVYSDCVEWSDSDLSSHAAGSVEPFEPEALTAETDCIPAFSPDWLRVYRNCERMNVESLSVEAGERGIARLTIPYNYPVSRGDLFHVIVEGSTILQGKAVTITKNRRQGIKSVECQTKTARLYGRYVLSQSHRTYSGQDIGAIAKDLVDYYFENLFTSNNININTGITVSDFDCYDKSVGDAFDELKKRGNVAFYIDGDNDVHFFVEGKEASNAIFNYDNIVGDIVVDEAGEDINTIIVKGLTGVSGQAGSGLPEVLVSDRRITTNAEAQEVAEALLDNYGVTTTTKFSVMGFYALKQGQSAILDAPLDGYNYQSINIEGVSWNLTPSGCVTNIVLGKLPVSFENVLLQTIRAIKEDQVNRISNHTGTDTGDSNPALEYTEVLGLSAGSEVRVQTSDVELRDGTCSSESDAATIVFAKVIVARGGSGGAGIARVNLRKAGTIKKSWLINIDANVTSVTLTGVFFEDWSGANVDVYAQGVAGTDVYLTATLSVQQILQHRHDVTQALEHEFD